MSTSDNPWIDFAKNRPEKGLFEWRIPSSAIPGMILIVAAHMRVRGAGFDTVLSPIFDSWDGYRVYVPSGLQWRKAGLHNIRTCDEKVIGIEGLDVAPCIYCGRVPSIQTYDQRSPHQSGEWRFQCCDWGKTPSMKDPREIEKVRRTAFSRARANADGWINPNDKTLKQYLPHIGEKVLFCHADVTYYGKHTGGSFQSFNPPRRFDTWDCLWMYPPKAREAQP